MNGLGHGVGAELHPGPDSSQPGRGPSPLKLFVAAGCSFLVPQLQSLSLSAQTGNLRLPPRHHSLPDRFREQRQSSGGGGVHWEAVLEGGADWDIKTPPAPDAHLHHPCIPAGSVCSSSSLDLSILIWIVELSTFVPKAWEGSSGVGSARYLGAPQPAGETVAALQLLLQRQAAVFLCGKSFGGCLHPWKAKLWISVLQAGNDVCGDFIVSVVGLPAPG